MRSADSSVGYRFSLWHSAWRTAREHLLFGIGEGRAALHAAIAPYAYAGLEALEHTHSLYLHLLLSVGPLGCLPFLFLLVRRLCHIKRFPATTAALISLLIFGLFDDPFYVPSVAVLFFFLLGCGQTKDQKGDPTYVPIRK
jgi:O-antigen ligase